MTDAIDPFFHHPELRGEIANPLTSPLRNLTSATLAAKMKELGLPQNWWRTDEIREAMRLETMLPHRDNDLWVFGYGSLMWNPGIRFAEVRLAHIADYARRFIVKDIYGGRGTMDAPGLMVALDRGKGCDGLLFRIEQDNIEEETEVLWRREMIAPAYKAKFVKVIVKDEILNALTFVADHDADLIDAKLTRTEQIQFLATGAGFMGSSLEYLNNIAEKLSQLGIHDMDVSELLRETNVYLGLNA
ncbi:MAG: gamma-glutamylcyclotransferase [Pseudomonadota bacterium]